MSDVQGFFAAIRAGDAGKVQAMLAEDRLLPSRRMSKGNRRCLLLFIAAGRPCAIF